MAAGAIATPKILMLSGIGPAAHLREHGIDAVVDQPGVGANLQDHTETPVVALCNGPYGYFGHDRGFRQMRNGLEYIVNRSGPVVSNGVEAGAFLDPFDLEGTPSVQQFCVPSIYLDKDISDVKASHGITINSCVARPRSQGSIRLASADPAEQPLIDPNYLADPEDVRLSIGGVRRAREIMAEAPLAGMIEREIFPGPEKQSDAELAEHARRFVKTVYHPCGTCRMGRGRPGGGGDHRPAPARDRGAPGRRRLGDADDHQRQHQCRRAGGGREGGGVHARPAAARRPPGSPRAPVHGRSLRRPAMPPMRPDPNPRMPYQHPMPKETLADIVIPDAIPADERVWVPQGENVWFRPLCLNRSQGYWMNLLRVRKSGVLSRHRHPQPVHGLRAQGALALSRARLGGGGGRLCLRAAGRDAHPGGAGRRGGDDHLLPGQRHHGLRRPLGRAARAIEDVFTKIDMCREHYAEVGLGADYVDQFIR